MELKALHTVMVARSASILAIDVTHATYENSSSSCLKNLKTDF